MVRGKVSAVAKRQKSGTNLWNGPEIGQRMLVRNGVDGRAGRAPPGQHKQARLVERRQRRQEGLRVGHVVRVPQPGHGLRRLQGLRPAAGAPLRHRTPAGRWCGGGGGLRTNSAPSSAHNAHKHTQTCTRTHAHKCIHTYTHAWTHAHTHAYMHAHTLTHIYPDTHTHTCKRISTQHVLC